MKKRIISVLIAICVIMMYSVVAFAEETTTGEEIATEEEIVEEVIEGEDTSSDISDLGDNTSDSKSETEEQLKKIDAHFFVRVDRVVQHENGNTHYEAKNYFPVGTVAAGYKYGSNGSDYASVDGHVKKMAHMNVEGAITDGMRAEAQEKIYVNMYDWPTKEEVIAAAEAYCKACGVSMNLENVDVLWYVIKNEGNTHVDGVLYNVETGEVVEAEDDGDDNEVEPTVVEPIVTPSPTPTPTPVIEPEGDGNIEPLEADTFTIKVVYIDERGNTIGSDEWVFNEGKGDYSIPVDWDEWFARDGETPDASEAYQEGEYLGFSWWESEQKNRQMVVYLCKKDNGEVTPYGDGEVIPADKDTATTSATHGVKTGDELGFTMTVYWILMIVVIALVIVGCVVVRRMDK